MENILQRFPVGIRSVTPLTDLNKLSPDLYRRIYDHSEFCSTKVVNIILVGCGGTGGYVLAELLRIIGGAPSFVQDKVYLTAIDGDEFEAKNLARQLCTEEDLGVNKAVALTTNYGSYFGCNMNHIIPIPEYLTSAEQLTSYVRGIPDFNRRSNNTRGSRSSRGKMDFNHRDTSTSFANNEVHCANKVLLNAENMNNTVQYDNQSYMTFYNDVSVMGSSCGGARVNSVVNIIIDCVDKNAPRKLIHDFLEKSWTRNSFEENLVNDIINNSYSEERTVDELLNTNSIISLTGNTNYHHTGASIVTYKDSVNTKDIATMDKMSVSRINSNDIHNNYPIRLSDDIMKEVSGNSETYVISSGNGQYTGQVYWGRYSYVQGGVYPLRYDDVWKDKAIHSSLLGKTKATLGIGSNNERFKMGDIKDVADPNNKLLHNLLLFQYNMAEDCTLENERRQHRLSETNLGIVGYRGLYSGTAGCMLHPHDENAVKQKDNPIYKSFESYVSSRVSVPTPYKRFPELIDLEADKIEDQMSCAERAEHNVQNIYANKTAAQLVINYFRTIFDSLFPLTGKPPVLLSTAGVSFDIRTNAVIPEYITTEYLQKYDTINQATEAAKMEEDNAEKSA